MSKIDFLDEYKQYIFKYADDEGFTETTKEKYESFAYPKIFKIMKFTTKQFEVKGFGKIMLMHTNAMGGMMKLLTISFMPNTGIEMPYLLIDMMSMKKKKACFIEYYDCTGKSLSYDVLESIKSKYGSVPEYEEKAAWYISERMKESMIKGGVVENPEKAQAMENDLLELAKESFNVYMSLIPVSPVDESNLIGLKKFKNRMQTEGNPSDKTMRTVLGEREAKIFFDEYVMPME